MKHFELAHRSVQWFDARSGIATASNFHKLITPTGKPSAQADDYANLLVAELIMGRSLQREFSTYALEWGETYEPEARELYQFETGLDVREGGMFVNDAMTYGASPDARCFEGDTMIGLAEIKCPENPANHIEFLIMDSMNPKYIPQVQGQLYVSGAEWVDWFSFYPEMPPARIRTYRDEAYLAALGVALSKFEESMQQKFAKLLSLGHISEVPIKTIRANEQPPVSTKPNEIMY